MKTYVKVLGLSILCASVAYADTAATASNGSRWVTEVMATPSLSHTTPGSKAANVSPMKEFLKKTVTPSNG